MGRIFGLWAAYPRYTDRSCDTVRRPAPSPAPAESRGRPDVHARREVAEAADTPLLKRDSPLSTCMLENLEDEVDMFGRHLEVLQHVVDDGPIGIVKLSERTGYPHHKARYSLRVLEDAGLIEATSQGAITTDRADDFIEEANDRIDDVADQLDGLKIEAEA